MNSLDDNRIHKPLGLLLLVVALGAPGWADRVTGGDYEIAKSLLGATGSSLVSGADYSLAYALGEEASGQTLGISTQVISGYLGGRFGSAAGLKLMHSQVEGPAFFQDGLRVGVPFNAAITLDFSDPLTAGTVNLGVHVFESVDRTGRAVNVPASIQTVYDPANRRLTLTPSSAWSSNTLYDIVLTPDLLSVDGFTLDQVIHIAFVTLLDPHVDNVVLHPLSPPTIGMAPGMSGAPSSGGLSLSIPSGALPDLAMVLFNADPLHNPQLVDPARVQEATDKAAAAGGPYRAPVQLEEITARTASGERIPALAKPAVIALAFDSRDGVVRGGPVPVRASSLALWVLDEPHSLWVKIPASQLSADGQQVSAPVPHFSVYALMGSPAGSAADAFVFPVPWRPYGPYAGEGAGQTGTMAGGMTFSNLPSECTIRIYTLSGDTVREIRHSDTGGSIGQERWDGKTPGGDSVASGVYLWRVESSQDGKNGKLMIIR